MKNCCEGNEQIGCWGQNAPGNCSGMTGCTGIASATEKVVNLTPHDIVVRTEDNKRVFYAFENKDCHARVATTPGRTLNITDGVPVHSPDKVGEITGLPEFSDKHDLCYIVSAIAAVAIKESGRNVSDLLVPGTSPQDNPYRNDAGQIVAVRYLKRV